MKKSNIILSLLFLSFNFASIAQMNHEGIFLTANDFSNGKASFGHNLSDTKYKFYLNDVSFKSPIKIVSGYTITKLGKDSIYGYRNKNNVCYRFYNKTAYKILNPKEKMLLYSLTSIASNPKDSHRVTNYFFSENANAPIYPLSKRNLKKVLSSNVDFNVLLDVYFPDDNELTALDDNGDKYLLNRVYEISLQPALIMSHK